MFIEVNSANRKTGWVEVVCGSMFSGKTEELIRRLRRAQIANQKVEIFKPMLDSRYSSGAIVSHDRNSIHSTPVSHSSEILPLALNVEVVGIDEAQFFDTGLPQVVRTLANSGVRVIVAGLDMDFRGIPFGPMPYLLAMAEFVTKVHAICQVCGSLANYSYRLSDDETTVLLGEKDSYEPRCRKCYFLGDHASESMPEDV
ncbi:MAG: thymidine kinase [Bacteroidia bacterium]|nr:thymidine kinase [Bacteroidia bacterium]